MFRVTVFVSNLALLTFALILYHGAFLAGHITRVGSMMLLAPLLTLFLCMTERKISAVRVLALIVNGALLLLSGWVYYGTTHLLVKNGKADPAAYVLVFISLLLAATAARSKGKMAGAAYIALLAVSAAFGLNCHVYGMWRQEFNAAVLGFIVLISGLNIFFAFSVNGRGKRKANA